MSTSLYWRPTPKDRPEPVELLYQLKKALARRFWGHDGSLYGDQIDVGRDALTYLEGLADAGVDGAQELIEAIREHDEVELWISG